MIPIWWSHRHIPIASLWTIETRKPRGLDSPSSNLAFFSLFYFPSLASLKNCFAFFSSQHEAHSMLFICCSFPLPSCFSALFRWWRYIGKKSSVSHRPRTPSAFSLQPESRPYALHERMERSKNHRLGVYMSFIRTLKAASFLLSSLGCSTDGAGFGERARWQNMKNSKNITHIRSRPSIIRKNLHTLLCCRQSFFSLRHRNTLCRDKSWRRKFYLHETKMFGKYWDGIWCWN